MRAYYELQGVRHCDKKYALEGRPQVLAFIIPQQIDPTDKAESYLTSIDEIEKRAHLRLGAAQPEAFLLRRTGCPSM